MGPHEPRCRLINTVNRINREADADAEERADAHAHPVQPAEAAREDPVARLALLRLVVVRCEVAAAADQA